jgi:hypothetical protein
MSGEAVVCAAKCPSIIEGTIPSGSMEKTMQRTKHARKTRPVGWSITKETDFSGCEQCKALKPPILEVIYKHSKRSDPQWHYLCGECTKPFVGDSL